MTNEITALGVGAGRYTRSPGGTLKLSKAERRKMFIQYIHDQGYMLVTRDPKLCHGFRGDSMIVPKDYEDGQWECFGASDLPFLALVGSDIDRMMETFCRMLADQTTADVMSGLALRLGARLMGESYDPANPHVELDDRLMHNLLHNEAMQRDVQRMINEMMGAAVMHRATREAADS